MSEKRFQDKDDKYYIYAPHEETIDLDESKDEQAVSYDEDFED